MNRKKFIIPIILTTVLAGALVYFFIANKSGTSIPTVAGNVTSTPSPTSTPSSDLISLPASVADIRNAKEALITYFNLLSTKQYEKALIYHGSGYETVQGWNPVLPKDDYATLIEYGCERNGWNCLAIHRIINEQAVSAEEVKFMVQFKNNDGSLFKRGPCCGATEAEMPTQTDFEYVVKKVNGSFVVMTEPPYTP